jgi:hypothetical protein
MSDETPTPTIADIIVRGLVVAIAQVIWFVARDYHPGPQGFFAWLYFEVLCACLFLRFMHPVFVSRVVGALSGVLIAELLLLLLTPLSKTWAWVAALAPPALGHLAWAAWNEPRERAQEAPRDSYRSALRHYEKEHPGASAHHAPPPREDSKSDGTQ